MNRESIEKPETEYHRQIEIEKYYDVELTQEEYDLLNKCETDDPGTIISIGLALKSTDDLNVGRLMVLTEDPNLESELKDRAMKIIGHIDREKVIDRLAEMDIESQSEVEYIVINRLFSFDFIYPEEHIFYN